MAFLAGARAPRCVAALLGELQAQAANFLNVLRAGGGDAAAPAPAGSCAAAAVAAHAAAAAHDALRSPEQEERSSRALANAIVDCAMCGRCLPCHVQALPTCWAHGGCWSLCIGLHRISSQVQ
jgi:hypothetical protein